MSRDYANKLFGAQVKDGRFEILRLPPGRYRLMFTPTVANRPAGSSVYYPGTQGPDAAALIEVVADRSRMQPPGRLSGSCGRRDGGNPRLHS